jgi:hypothetical protein
MIHLARHSEWLFLPKTISDCLMPTPKVKKGYSKKEGNPTWRACPQKRCGFVKRYFLAIRTCSMEAGPRASSTSFFGVLGARYVSSTPRSARYID